MLMNHLKTYESFNSNKIDIPDDLAKWCIDLILSQPYKSYDVNKIPTILIEKTKEFVNKKSKGYIWRGFGMDTKLTDVHLNVNGNREFKYDWGASWTYSNEIGIEFASFREEEAQYGYLAKVNINKLKYPLLIDIVIDNLSQEQLDKFKFDKTHYSSEKEVVVMEEFEVPTDDIELIIEPDIKQEILYHGSPNKFKTFNSKNLGSNMGETPSNMKGFFFSDNKEVAQSFGEYLYKCVVVMRNPFIVDAKGQDYSEFKFELNEIVDNISKEYDSIVIKNYKDSFHDDPMMSNQYIIFKPGNIKIVT